MVSSICKIVNVNYSWLTGVKSGFICKGEFGGWVEYLNEEQSAYFEDLNRRVVQADGHVRCNLYVFDFK